MGREIHNETFEANFKEIAAVTSKGIAEEYTKKLSKRVSWELCIKIIYKSIAEGFFSEKLLIPQRNCRKIFHWNC